MFVLGCEVTLNKGYHLDSCSRCTDFHAQKVSPSARPAEDHLQRMYTKFETCARKIMSGHQRDQTKTTQILTTPVVLTRPQASHDLSRDHHRCSVIFCHSNHPEYVETVVPRLLRFAGGGGGAGLAPLLGGGGGGAFLPCILVVFVFMLVPKLFPPLSQLVFRLKPDEYDNPP